MAQFQECLNEWHTLVGDLRLYIAQEHTQEFPDLQQQDLQLQNQIVTPCKPVIKAASIVKPVVEPKPVLPSSVPKKPSMPKPKEVEIPKTPLEPIMQALCRPFTKPPAISLADCLEKFRKLGIPTIEAPEIQPQVSSSQIVMLSFFDPGSEEEKFIQKVASSVQMRLIACSLYLQPGLSAAAGCFTLAASGHCSAIVIMMAQEDAPKLAHFLAYFGDDLHASEIQKELLSSKRSLFGTSLYELILTPAMMSDTAQKRALWNDLQKLL